MSEDRIGEMVRLFSDGLTLQQIASRFGISRQRVHVLICRRGVTRNAGGFNSARIKEYGFSTPKEFDDALARFPGCIDKFRQQRVNARMRGIEFRFSLKQWLDVWGDQWNRRGIGGDALVMCRRNDVGAYEPGNVYIATCGQNAIDYQAGKGKQKRLTRRFTACAVV
mgnify:FL=1